MHIQHCVKGIRGASAPNANDGLTWNTAVQMIADGSGITSNWWRNKGLISPPEVREVLTDDNLDRHLHDYDVFGKDTPFISLSAGSILRDPSLMTNLVYDAVDTALSFATDDGAHPGALFFCWTTVGFHPAVPFAFISEPVRDLLIYRSWSPFLDEGEIVAKVHIPAHQVKRVEWWDPAASYDVPIQSWDNLDYQPPNPLLNERDMVRDL